MIKKASIALAAISLLIVAGCTQASQKDTTDVISNDTEQRSEIVQNLQKGGYVVYFRHAQTETDYADQINATLGDCSTQRTLSEDGWKQAQEIGEAFKDLNIPVGKVYSSEYCRAWQTADLAFGKYETTSDLNFFPAEEYTDEQMATMNEAVKPYLIQIPSTGENTVIVGHDDVFEAATGIYPEPQGVAYILKPNGENFEIIQRVASNEWNEI